MNDWSRVSIKFYTVAKIERRWVDEIFSDEKEEYLKLISHYQMRDGIARTGVLAKKLGITKSSVTEMFQRLAEEEFVKYTA